MRIPNKVVCLWSCLTAFTFIHTADAQDYRAEPLSGAGNSGVTVADYAGSATLGDGGAEEGYSPEYAAMAYQDANGAYVDPGAQGFYPPPVTQGYPPPMGPMGQPNMNYWPEVSPFAEPIIDKTYRQNGIWVNDPLMGGERQYLFSTEYMRTWLARPGTDTIGSPRVNPFFSGPRVAEPVTAGVFGNGTDLVSDGVRAKFSIVNPDKSMLELSGFWIAEGQQIFQPFAPGDPNRLSTLHERGFVGLEDGAFGARMRFDTDFRLTYKSQAMGADLTWTTTPLYETDGFRLKPMFGLKYLKIREQFDLFGQDSSRIGSIGLNPFGNPALTSTLTSQTGSDLLGPEAGIRYELGGKNFLVWGQTRLAVMGNHETIAISGNNMVDALIHPIPIPTPSDPQPLYFRDAQSHTRVSPVFSQDFYFRAKVFKHLPFFNDFALLANADMLVGYNFVLVGGVARPTKLIDWRETNPRIDLNHSRWFMQAATFGLEWKF